MEERMFNANELEMEMITLTKEERQYMEALENNLAGGGGHAIICICKA